MVTHESSLQEPHTQSLIHERPSADPAWGCHWGWAKVLGWPATSPFSGKLGVLLDVLLCAVVRRDERLGNTGGGASRFTRCGSIGEYGDGGTGGALIGEGGIGKNPSVHAGGADDGTCPSSSMRRFLWSRSGVTAGIGRRGGSCCDD